MRSRSLLAIFAAVALSLAAGGCEKTYYAEEHPYWYDYDYYYSPYWFGGDRDDFRQHHHDRGFGRSEHHESHGAARHGGSGGHGHHH